MSNDTIKLRIPPEGHVLAPGDEVPVTEVALSWESLRSNFEDPASRKITLTRTILGWLLFDQQAPAKIAQNLSRLETVEGMPNDVYRTIAGYRRVLENVCPGDDLIHDLGKMRE